MVPFRYLIILLTNLFAGTGPSKTIDSIYQNTFAGTDPSKIINLNFPTYFCWDRSEHKKYLKFSNYVFCDRSQHKNQFNFTKMVLPSPVPEKSFFLDWSPCLKDQSLRCGTGPVENDSFLALNHSSFTVYNFPFSLCSPFI